MKHFKYNYVWFRHEYKQHEPFIFHLGPTPCLIAIANYSIRSALCQLERERAHLGIFVIYSFAATHWNPST